MNYYEVNFKYTSTIEKETINDILAAELAEIGYESFTENPEGLSAYVKENIYDQQALADVLEQFPLPDTQIEFTYTIIEGKDWNEEWEKNYFQPIRIGDECIIHASFHEDISGYQYKIIIDPKMAFGTGNHETTYLMINELLKLDLQGKKFLDMGCGTAVLAILASMRGADPIIAIDIDEWAYNNALENIALNNIENIQVLQGGAEVIPQTEFDIIFANINRNILLNDIHHYTTVLKPGGSLFMSGFYKEDIPVIEEECNRNGLTFLSHIEKNNWVAVRTEKGNNL